MNFQFQLCIVIGMIRPRGPPNAHQMMPPQRSPFGPYSQPNHPGNMRLPMNPSMPPHVPPINAAIPSQSLPLPLIGAPRKVLINPNFKGGVQAATSKYFDHCIGNRFVLFNRLFSLSRSTNVRHNEKFANSRE